MIARPLRGIVDGELRGLHGIVLRGRKIGTGIRIVLLGESSFTEASKGSLGKNRGIEKRGKANSVCVTRN